MYYFSFHNPVTACVGRGRSEEIESYCLGQRVLLLSDAVVSTLPQYQKIKGLLGDKVAAEYTGILPNPESGMVDQILQLLDRANVDCVIGIGGGSTLDTAKLVASIAGENVPVEEYLNGMALPRRKMPLVLMPTTSGTGSEVTNIAVITSGATHKKVALANDVLYCDIAVIDPELTATVPAKVTASTGFDALCHALEALWSTNATPPSDALAAGAIGRITANLEQACAGAPNAREEMAVASYLAGLAFNQTRTNACHANSYYLTTNYHVDHGSACAVTIIPFLKYNLSAVREKVDGVARQCGFTDGERLILELERIHRNVGLKERLSDYGVTAGDIEPMVDAILANQTSFLNPAPITRESMSRFLTDLL